VLHTGDSGYLDSNGNLFLTGLKKKMINCAGKKVYIAELVRHLQKVSNVVDVAILGKKDVLLHELIEYRMRYFSLEKQKYFRAWCRQNLSAHKFPYKFANKSDLPLC
jgi:acyl-CoA synthetase (AMP-forming)/AMP-acid ligase II